MRDVLDVVEARLAGDDRALELAYVDLLTDAGSWDRGLAQRFWILAVLAESAETTVADAVRASATGTAIPVDGSDRAVGLAIALAESWQSQDDVLWDSGLDQITVTRARCLLVAGTYDRTIMSLAWTVGSRAGSSARDAVLLAASTARPGLFTEPLDRS